jgi:hypothetical protein
MKMSEALKKIERNLSAIHGAGEFKKQDFRVVVVRDLELGDSRTVNKYLGLMVETGRMVSVGDGRYKLNGGAR